MNHSDNLVPEPQNTILDVVNDVARKQNKTADEVIPPAAGIGPLGSAPVGKNGDVHGGDGHAPGVAAVKGEGKDAAGDESSIPLKAVDDIGRATAGDVKEALHQVIDPELGIDVIDLGLVYGIEIDKLGRAIITMTLTTPACPLTNLIEDECSSVLAGLVEEFRIDWTWTPRWTLDRITPDGRDQLAALGFNFSAMPYMQYGSATA